MSEKVKSLNVVLIYFLGMFLFPIIAYMLVPGISDLTMNIVFQVGVLIAALMIYKDSLIKESKGWCKWYEYILYVIILVSLIIIGNSISMMLLEHFGFGIESNTQNQEFIVSLADQSKGQMILLTVCLAPIVEELVFRAGIYHLVPGNKWIKVIVTTLVFALVHCKMNLMELCLLPCYIAPSLVMTLVYSHNDNIAEAIGFHMLNNIYALLTTIV